VRLWEEIELVVEDDEEDDEEDEDEDPTLSPHGVPVTPISQYLHRTGRSNLD